MQPRLLLCMLVVLQGCAGGPGGASRDAGGSSPDAGELVPDAGCDQDGDGVDGPQCNGPDCQDGNQHIHPGKPDVCDGQDNDCDGQVDLGPGVPCEAFSLRGESVNAELGFRFSPPADMDGDGVADIAAGARFTILEATEMGVMGAWSGKDGTELAHFEGHAPNGLFGHTTLTGLDVDQDGHMDVLGGAPQSNESGLAQGVIFARSVHTQRLLWTRKGNTAEVFGWHMSLAQDHDGDGVRDVLVGAPGTAEAEAGQPRVALISGRTGLDLLSITGPAGSEFGWFVTAIPDVDGDGLEDAVVGSPSERWDARGRLGAVTVFSLVDGHAVRRWEGTTLDGQFGEVVAGLPDVDGDGRGDVAVGSPHLWAETGQLAGEVHVFSGVTGATLQHWTGTQERELFGRMVSWGGDVDGDGRPELFIGAPWANAGGLAKAGRVELRSCATGAVVWSTSGSAPEWWTGWHVEQAEHLGVTGAAKGFVLGSLRAPRGDITGAGTVQVMLWGR